ncbi:melanopsin-like [Paramacrobiotus metropolitanus]|uniref:melanopsin-like n=1 Tax=Paramacrobiotus metropolitanus TaxID=2943436 RepID=UPI002446500F|nr:melanopsin-like [Paramacrobiotus metropolitanus]
MEGALGNLLIVYVIISQIRLRTGCGLLIANCLVAYTILCGFSFPIVGTSVYRKQFGQPVLGPQSCKPLQWIQLACRFAAYWFDLFIAINRVVAVCYPYRYRTFSRPCHVIVGIVGLWLTALAYSSLGWFDIGVNFIMLPLGTCAALPSGRMGQVVLYTGFYMPGASTTGLYVFLYAMIKRGKQQIQPESARNPRQRKIALANQRRMITTNMMCVSFVWTAACSMILPVTISLIKVAEDEVKQPLAVIWLAAIQLLGYAVNPVG